VRSAFERAGTCDQRQRQGVAEAHGSYSYGCVGLLIQGLKSSRRTMKGCRAPVNGPSPARLRISAPRPSHHRDQSQCGRRG
jgi:hypothetical protein